MIHNLCNLRDSWQGSITSQELEPTLGLLQNQWKSLLLAHQLCLSLDDKRFLSWIHNGLMTQSFSTCYLLTIHSQLTASFQSNPAVRPHSYYCLLVNRIFDFMFRFATLVTNSSTYVKFNCHTVYRVNHFLPKNHPKNQLDILLCDV